MKLQEFRNRLQEYSIERGKPVVAFMPFEEMLECVREAYGDVPEKDMLSRAVLIEGVQILTERSVFDVCNQFRCSGDIPTTISTHTTD